MLISTVLFIKISYTFEQEFSLINSKNDTIALSEFKI